MSVAEYMDMCVYIYQGLWYTIWLSFIYRYVYIFLYIQYTYTYVYILYTYLCVTYKPVCMYVYI